MAVEMVRLFQVQLEHYEKVEGVDALASRARPTSWPRWCASTCPWPCRAWPSSRCSPATTLARGTGRIFTYDVTGGHYEETDFQATGSGGRDARTTIKLGYREGLARDEAVELAIESLYEAADEDSATGGPDLVRGIYPIVAMVDADGLPARSPRTRWPSASPR